jgi:hypothetical protein
MGAHRWDFGLEAWVACGDGVGIIVRWMGSQAGIDGQDR